MMKRTVVLLFLLFGAGESLHARPPQFAPPRRRPGQDIGRRVPITTAPRPPVSARQPRPHSPSVRRRHTPPPARATSAASSPSLSASSIDYFARRDQGVVPPGEALLPDSGARTVVPGGDLVRLEDPGYYKVPSSRREPLHRSMGGYTPRPLRSPSPSRRPATASSSSSPHPAPSWTPGQSARAAGNPLGSTPSVYSRPVLLPRRGAWSPPQPAYAIPHNIQAILAKPVETRNPTEQAMVRSWSEARAAQAADEEERHNIAIATALSASAHEGSHLVGEARRLIREGHPVVTGRPVVIRSDGSCMFGAIAYGLRGSHSAVNAGRVRGNVVQSIAEKARDDRGFRDEWIAVHRGDVSNLVEVSSGVLKTNDSRGIRVFYDKDASDRDLEICRAVVASPDLKVWGTDIELREAATLYKRHIRLVLDNPDAPGSKYVTYRVFGKRSDLPLYVIFRGRHYDALEVAS